MTPLAARVNEMGRRVELSHDAKLFIVRCLAEWMTPSDTADALFEQFGVRMTRQSMEHYDPTKRQGERIDVELAKVFWAKREAFIKDGEARPSNNANWRQRERERIYDSTTNKVLRKDLLEDMAKEAGGFFTNKVKVAGHDGGAVEVVTLTDAERKKRIAEMLANAQTRKESGRC